MIRFLLVAPMKLHCNRKMALTKKDNVLRNRIHLNLKENNRTERLG